MVTLLLPAYEGSARREVADGLGGAWTRRWLLVA